MTTLYDNLPTAGRASAPVLVADTALTGMVDAILREIVDLLGELGRTGAAAVVDLSSMPLTTADREELEKRLGRGEVEARISVAGDSEVWETKYAGVWWVRHRGATGRIACEQIAVTTTPDILISNPDDVRDAVLRLARDLDAATDSAKEKEEAANG